MLYGIYLQFQIALLQYFIYDTQYFIYDTNDVNEPLKTYDN